MNFEERLAAAHQELESKGVWHANYNPLAQIAAQTGPATQATHYERFLVNILALGLPTGAIWEC